MRKSDFEYLISLLLKNAGWQLDEEQYFVLDKKISNFIREKGFASVEDLIKELKSGNKSLIEQVVAGMAFSDTSFYRDYDVFKHFEDVMLPFIKENNRSRKTINFWSLGCASGQETYSIAFAVKRKFVGLENWNIKILGTDLSPFAINKAQRGIYNNFEVQHGLNADMILNFFHQNIDNKWQVNEDIMKLVDFRRYNMLDDIASTFKYEVVFCRNVLRYFTPDYQQLILQRISNSQNKGGILYLGKNEYIKDIEKYYDNISGYDCVYVCKGNNKISSTTQEHYTQTENKPEKVMPKFVRPSNF